MRYKDWLSFREATHDGSAFTMNDVTTYFDVFENISGSEDWTIIEYQPTNARYCLDADEKLAETLSKSLNTRVIKYYGSSSTRYYSIYGYSNGILKDVLNFEWGTIYKATGFFEKYNQLNQKYDQLSNSEKDLDLFEQMSTDDYHKMVAGHNDYLNSLKLNLDLNELGIMRDNHCRGFLLNGDPIPLQKYLKIEKLGTLDLNPLKGL